MPFRKAAFLLRKKDSVLMNGVPSWKTSSKFAVVLFNDETNAHCFENFLSAVIFVLSFTVPLILQFLKISF